MITAAGFAGHALAPSKAGAFFDCDAPPGDDAAGDPNEFQECLQGGPLGLLEMLGGDNAAEFCYICAIRNWGRLPVTTSNGNFWHTFNDLTVPGRGVPLSLVRTYNALAASTSGPLGYGWTFNYSMSIAIDPVTLAATVNQENGAQVTFTASNGLYVAPARVIATLVKNGDGSFTFTRRATEIFTFNGAGQLTAQKDLNGYATTISRPNAGTIVVTDPAGRALTLTFTGSNLTAVTDPASPPRHITFAYDASGNLTDVIDVNGGHSQFTYDGSHRLLTMREPKYYGDTTTSPSPVVTNTYDGSNRVVLQSDQLGRATQYDYTSIPGATKVTDPKGNVTVDHYSNGLLASETKAYNTPLAATWTYTYDNSTLGLTSAADPNGHTTSYTYDASGNRTSTTDANGHVTSFTYNALNEVTATRDPKGITTSITYDANGNRLSRSRPLLDANGAVMATATTTYGYLENGDTHPGDVTSMTDPNRKRWTYGYDASGDRTDTTDPVGDHASSTYNNIGWRLTTVSPRGNQPGAHPSDFTTTWTYDGFGDPLTVTDPLGHLAVMGYDANRNQTMAKDPNGNTTTWSFDAANENRSTIRADGTRTLTDYDAAGHLRSQTDGLNNATTYSFDALNHMSASTDPLGRSTGYSYDAIGNLDRLTDAQGQATHYVYDPANQLLSITYSDGATPNVSFTYDPNGQRLSMSDGIAQGAVQYTYDSLNRRTGETRPNGGFMAYAYDLGDRLTSMRYTLAASPDVTRTYDDAGRMASVKDAFGDTTTFGYDADGNLTSEAYPNGATAVTTYDVTDRIQHITDTGSSGVLLDLPYTRDADGQVTSVNPLGTSPGTVQQYSYDQLNRVTHASVSSSPTRAFTEVYGYDAGDNLTGLTSGGNGECTVSCPQSSSFTYDVANEAVSKATSLGTRRFTYDLRGNRTSTSTTGGTTSYQYDQAGRFVSLNAGPRYEYDGDGLLYQHAEYSAFGTAFGQMQWDKVEGTPLLVDDGLRSYISGPGGRPVEMLPLVSGSSSALYYHQDQLGSTRLLTSSTGQVVQAYNYDAYGNTIASSGTVQANPLQFAGQYLDTNSGFYYMRARFYDPATGQFISRDPMVATTRSAYGYASDNPLNNTDPSGLTAPCYSRDGTPMCAGAACNNNPKCPHYHEDVGKEVGDWIRGMGRCAVGAAGAGVLAAVDLPTIFGGQLWHHFEVVSIGLVAVGAGGLLIAAGIVSFPEGIPVIVVGIAVVGAGGYLIYAGVT